MLLSTIFLQNYLDYFIPSYLTYFWVNEKNDYLFIIYTANCTDCLLHRLSIIHAIIILINQHVPLFMWEWIFMDEWIGLDSQGKITQDSHSRAMSCHSRKKKFTPDSSTILLIFPLHFFCHAKPCNNTIILIPIFISFQNRN